MDIGSSFVPAGKESLLKKLEILQNEPLANFVSHWTKERVWCKGDVFAYFDVLDNPKYIDGGTAKGGTIFMKKCEKTIAFMREWLEIFWQFFELVDDSPSKIPNYPEFIENRHDQTILSMLLKKHNIYTFEDYHRHDHSNIEFGIIDTRDKVGLDLPRLNNQQKVTKILRFLGKILPNQKLRHDFRSLSGHIHRI
ncbi:hypothetical protein DCO58_06290 [Helicobacter saguini]|uniref:Uncharacterized protein n=1 Tax=Helicobacter saguini TaxID=1548018 RepID=A0A4U8T483_9HELI|nr:hypothetical protein [Helicobacter saguini]MWV67276.1 hypothetical protein [Helicobacter saguini]MWV69629.1 hypothetical protein [Helicobacter saguini]MWV70820.1 hypothetical protein [Helicobacter saguini]TLD94339.1 hypothetical protein LS64_006400 [Helicobacter saguini]